MNPRVPAIQASRIVNLRGSSQLRGCGSGRDPIAYAVVLIGSSLELVREGVSSASGI